MAAKGKHHSSPLPPKSTAADQLILGLFDGRPNALSMPIEYWVISSKSFMAFAQTYQQKIRKKISVSRNADETYNLYCELRTAYLLLQEPKFTVAYEPYGKEHGRSADFAVTFRTHTTFHVEVTRLRTSQQEQQFYQQKDNRDKADKNKADKNAEKDKGKDEEKTDLLLRHESRRIADVVCDKFAQSSPSTPNILWIWSESRVMHKLDIGQVMLDLKRRVEQKDASTFARYGFEKPADFIRYYQRVSAILVQSLHTPEPHRSHLWWKNKDARHPLPTAVTNRLHSLVTADTSQRSAANHAQNR